MPLYFTKGLMSGRREDDEWEVEEVVKHRRTRDGRLEFLVKWQGVDAAENTWEPPSSFLPQYCKPWATYCRAQKLPINLLDHLRTG